MTETKTEEPTYVEVEPLQEFEAPIFPRSMKRTPKIDLADVERLAALGLRPAAIGPNIGLSIRSFELQWGRKRLIREAYERGNAIWQRILAERMAKYAADGGKEGVTATIFSLKQAHGSNWSDHVTTSLPERDNTAQAVFEARKKKVTALPAAPKLLEKGEVERNDDKGVVGRVAAVSVRSRD